jgi:hypothetical protein
MAEEHITVEVHFERWRLTLRAGGAPIRRPLSIKNTSPSEQRRSFSQRLMAGEAGL